MSLVCMFACPSLVTVFRCNHVHQPPTPTMDTALEFGFYKDTIIDASVV